MKSMRAAVAPRAALKSRSLTCDVSHNQVDTSAHLLCERWAGAIARLGLTPRPGSVFSLNGSSQDAEHRRGHGVTDSAAILSSTHVQAVMKSVFDAPVLADQFEQSLGIGLVRAQAGNDPDGLDFLLAAAQLANPIDPRDLGHMRKAHLCWSEGLALDAAPFNATVALVDLQKLRGKNLPEGSVALALGGCLDWL